MPTIGLDLGTASIKAVLVEPGHPPRLLASCRVDHTMPGWAADLSSDRAATTAAALEPLVKKAITGLGWTRQYRVRVTIPDRLVVTQIRRERDVPADPRVARLALGEAVRKELNLAPVWTVRDCVLIERPPKGTTRPCRVAVAVTQQPLVDAIHTLVARIGYRMSHLDTDTWALSTLALPTLAPAQSTGLHGILNLGHSYMAFALFAGDVLQEYAVADGGGAECCENLALVVGPGMPREVLTRRTIIPTGADKDDPQVFEAFGAVGETIMRGATLVRDRLEAHALFSGVHTLERLTLAGGLASLRNLPQLLSEEFGVPAGVLPVSDLVAAGQGAGPGDLPALAAAIGMSVRQE